MKKLSIALLTLIVALAMGCAEHKRSGDVELLFVRGGLAVSGSQVKSAKVASGSEVVSAETVRLGPDRLLAEFNWSAGDKFTVTTTDAGGSTTSEITAPTKPSPFQVAVVELEDVEAHASGTGSAPDTFVKFSPDGGSLAIGSFKGYLRVVDAYTGEIKMQKKIAEGIVKRIGWGEIDGRAVIYVGEQSPDGFVYCYDAETGDEIWKYRLADDIGYSNPLEHADRYSLYHFPGAFHLKVVSGGDVIVAGTHGWNEGEEYIYKCYVYRFDGRTGEVKWKWPADSPVPYSIMWMAANKDGSRIVLMTSTWLEIKNQRDDIRLGAYYCLDGNTGEVYWEYMVPPLKPYFNVAAVWQAIDISADGKYALLGLWDGRAMLFDVEATERKPGERYPVNKPLWVAELGTPVMVGDIPVTAQISYAAFGNNEVYFVMPGTSIPPSAGTTQKRQPAPHPAAHHIFALGIADGKPTWEWRTPGSTQGIDVSGDRKWMGTVTAEVYGTAKQDFFGVTMFDTSAEGGGKEKLAYTYSTEGPMFFMTDISDDGRLMAAVETPFRLSDGKTVVGDYRVHIIH